MNDREYWYVTTDFFRKGGRIVRANGVHGLGPYPSRAEALACREGFEHGARLQGLFFVDQVIVKTVAEGPLDPSPGSEELQAAAAKALGLGESEKP